MTEAKNSVIFEARTAHKLRVPAEVTDAQFELMIDRLTEVLAEPTDNPDHFKITWPYGVTSASAVVHRSSLQFS